VGRRLRGFVHWSRCPRVAFRCGRGVERIDAIARGDLIGLGFIGAARRDDHRRHVDRPHAVACAGGRRAQLRLRGQVARDLPVAAARSQSRLGRHEGRDRRRRQPLLWRLTSWSLRREVFGYA
jgi:hypothetical protein